MINEKTSFIIKKGTLTDAGSPEVTGLLSDGAVILMDKPKGWTSFDVVNKIRRSFRLKKAGHAGTLDPMATGLLIVCTGRKTKGIESYVGMDKVYTGTMKLGEITPSLDADTEVTERRSFSHLTEDKIIKTAEDFTGISEQTPPMYSAIKHKGRALYKLARKGIEVERKSRKVTIHSFEITGVNLPLVSFSVRCSKGTYIRSLADDFGRRLQTGAHLTELRRTAIGEFLAEEASDIEEIIEFANRVFLE